MIALEQYPECRHISGLPHPSWSYPQPGFNFHVECPRCNFETIFPSKIRHFSANFPSHCLERKWCTVASCLPAPCWENTYFRTHPCHPCVWFIVSHDRCHVFFYREKRSMCSIRSCCDNSVFIPETIVILWARKWSWAKRLYSTLLYCIHGLTKPVQ